MTSWKIVPLSKNVFDVSVPFPWLKKGSTVEEYAEASAVSEGSPSKGRIRMPFSGWRRVSDQMRVTGQWKWQLARPVDLGAFMSTNIIKYHQISSNIIKYHQQHGKVPLHEHKLCALRIFTSNQPVVQRPRDRDRSSAPEIRTSDEIWGVPKMRVPQ